MAEEEKILECSTAKFKLEEARYFLERLSNEEIWNNEMKFGFYLNAFVISANTVLDYVHADFIYNTINNPRIDWREFEDRDKKKIISQKHPDKESIGRFLSKYHNELDKFYREPLGNYFRYKRNKITHVQWDGAKSGSFKRKDGKGEAIISRQLEPDITYMMVKENKEYDLDLFDDRIMSENQLKTLERLCSESLISILNEYLCRLERFIQVFDGKDFFKKL